MRGLTSPGSFTLPRLRDVKVRRIIGKQRHRKSCIHQLQWWASQLCICIVGITLATLYDLTLFAEQMRWTKGVIHKDVHLHLLCIHER